MHAGCRGESGLLKVALLLAAVLASYQAAD